MERFTRPVGKPTRNDIVRIEMIEKPSEYEEGAGLYEWRYMNDRFSLDIVNLRKELILLGGIFRQRAEQIIDRIQNFRILYLNLRTGEVRT